MKNNREFFDFLKPLEKREWFELFDFIFENNSLPEPFPYLIDYPTEHFDRLFKIIQEINDKNISNKYNVCLLEYYFSFPADSFNYRNLYALHNVFFRIKLKVNSDKLFQQLFTNQLLNKYYEGIHLQTSLLSLLSELPNLFNYDISTYLFNTINQTDNLAFYRIGLKYFIKQHTSYDYFKYLETIASKLVANEKQIANLIVESLMDFRLYKGSFEFVYKNIDTHNIWYNLYNKKNSLLKEIILIFNDKYLKEGKKWFDNDIYAQLFKAYINSFEYPPAPNILINLTTELELKGYDFFTIKNLITKPLNNSILWNDYMLVDFIDNEEDEEDEKVNNIYYVEKKGWEELDEKILSFYFKSYGLEKNDLYVKNHSNLFDNIFTYNKFDSLKIISLNNPKNKIKIPFNKPYNTDYNIIDDKIQEVVLDEFDPVTKLQLQH